MAEKPRIALKPAKYYHLFNRGVNRTMIFQEPADYEKFLRLTVKHLKPIGQLYSYALMTDHWHLCISTLPFDQLPLHRRKDKHSLSRVIGHFQNAYAKYYNYKYRRVSSVFEHKFERHEIQSLEYLKNLIIYHHFNPQKHGFIDNYTSYPWSSYRELASETAPTQLCRDQVWNKFGGRQSFLKAHENYNEAFWDNLTVE